MLQCNCGTTFQCLGLSRGHTLSIVTGMSNICVVKHPDTLKFILWLNSIEINFGQFPKFFLKNKFKKNTVFTFNLTFFSSMWHKLIQVIYWYDLVESLHYDYFFDDGIPLPIQPRLSPSNSHFSTPIPSHPLTPPVFILFMLQVRYSKSRTDMTGWNRIRNSRLPQIYFCFMEDREAEMPIIIKPDKNTRRLSTTQ